MRRIEGEQGVFVSRQPSERELQALPDQGIRSVINLRSERGERSALSTEDERRMVEHGGLRYIPVPIPRDRLDTAATDRFLETLRGAPRPVLIHGRDAHRAAALALLDRAVQEGWDAEETFEQARAMDIQITDRRLEGLMEDYLEAHSEKRVHGPGKAAEER